MPLYYFDIYDGVTLTTDVSGTVCHDDMDAHYEAIRALPLIAKDALPNGDHALFWVKVRTLAGESIFQASLELKAGWLSPSKQVLR